MLLVIDNYDSFTYNLVQYLGELGQQVRVVRNDEVSVDDIEHISPEYIVISPGPCTPNEAGVSLDVIRRLAGKIPILGVCLGHQAIGQAFGGKVIRAKEVVHGRTSRVFHDDKGIFAGLPNPFEATRYHSLMVERSSLPGLPGNHRQDLGRRNHGPAPQEPAGGRRAVSPRVVPDQGGQGPAAQLLAPGEGRMTGPVAGATPGLGMREALAQVVAGRSLSTADMSAVVGCMMDGEATPAQVGGLLAALRMKGETVDEVVGAASAMRQRMLRVPAGEPALLDTCGTGGDGSGTVNISTLASFIVAACGVKVAKHGNRALSSRSGSHDVIEAMGIDPMPTPETALRCLAEVGLCFMFAPNFHAATRHVAGPRRELGFRTLFNLLGPLTNPAGARYHMNGVFAAERCEFLAQAHAQTGIARRHGGARRGRAGRDRHFWIDPGCRTARGKGSLLPDSAGGFRFGRTGSSGPGRR